MTDILFSLIVPTVHRTRELSRFLESIVLQKIGLIQLDQIEIVLVDQNEDDRLLKILEPYGDKLRIVHLRNRQKGVSNGKNAGLKEIRGRYVAFPDDDCFYEKDTLERVFKFFQETEGRQGLFGRGLDPGNGKEALGYPGRKILIYSPRDSWVFLGIQWTQFFTAEMVRAVGEFDNNFGIGGRWGSGEETDFAIRCLKKGYSIFFDPKILVYHHRVAPDTMETAKIREYATGFGALCRHYGLTGHFLFKTLKQAGGASFFILTGRWRKFRVCLELILCRWQGYWGYDVKSGDGPGRPGLG